MCLSNADKVVCEGCGREVSVSTKANGLSHLCVRERPSIDQYFLSMAELASSRSTWRGMRVGCVVVQDKQVVSTGYNGTPRGYNNDLDRDKKEYFCHAEENAIVQAARHGIRLNRATFYCTVSPCLTCARMMVNLGIVRLVFRDRWDHEVEMNKALRLLVESGVVVDRGV